MTDPSTPRTRKCGNPNCDNPRLSGRFVCEEHGPYYDKLREEFEDNPNSIYKQRSDNPNRKLVDNTTKKTAPKSPTCCVVGCFSPRIPPSPYCSDHEDFAGGD